MLNAIPSPSFGLVLAFVGLAAVLAVGFIWAVRRAGRSSDRKHRVTTVWTVIAASLAGAWLALTGALAQWGALAFGPTPPPALVLFFSGFVLAMVFLFSPPGRQLAIGLPLWLLVGFQAFRIPVELLLHRAYVEGLMPVQMSYLGLNFDVLTGLTALPVALLIARGLVPRWAVAVWNVIGLGLLLNILTIAILSTPTPLRVFHNEPANLWVTTFPFVWLPTVMVIAALSGHVLVFRRLFLDRQLVSETSVIDEREPDARVEIRHSAVAAGPR